MLKKYSALMNDIYSNIRRKERFMANLSSLLLAFFIVFPFFLMTGELLEIYYELQVLLMIVLCILTFVFFIIYTKFLIDIYCKKIENREKSSFKYLYIYNMIYPIVFTICEIISYFCIK
ncbi:MAG: hypothetical protein ACI35W_06165 [Anaeroplasmataceae bacterium]